MQDLSRRLEPKSPGWFALLALVCLALAIAVTA